MTLEWIPDTEMLDGILQENMKLRTDNHVAWTRIDFYERHGTEDKSDHSELAQRVSRLMPKTIAALIAKANDDVYMQTLNNNAYHLPLDMVNAYVQDFVNRHVFHCVHFWRKAVPAPGITVPKLTDQDVIRYTLDLDIAGQDPGGPMYSARLLTARMSLWYPQGFMTYFKTDPISV